jgi:hypothetical protein
MGGIMMHLTPKELAARWHFSTGTLANWRITGYGPRFLKFGRRVLYPLVEVEAWEAEHLRANTAC